MMRQTFLEKPKIVADETVDHLEALLRAKFEVKTGFADANQAARALFHALRTLEASGDEAVTPLQFRVLMQKVNCGEDLPAVDAMFRRYDTRDEGTLRLKEFADGLFGLRRVAQANPPCRGIIQRVRKLLLARGENGFRGMVRILRRMDDNGNRKLDKRELAEGLATYGLHLTPKEQGTLFPFFDRDGDGQITITEFIVGLRPTMSPARLGIVKLAFLRLDRNPDGVVTLQELQTMYRADQHPAVLDGSKTPMDVIAEFNDSWDKNGDEEITEREFCDYYKDLSAGIDNDAYFELMVRNAWHISGGEGAAANTSNLRVLVTHVDGTQDVECIENDLGLPDHKEATLIAALKKQGVSDILKVETHM